MKKWLKRGILAAACLGAIAVLSAAVGSVGETLRRDGF